MRSGRLGTKKLRKNSGVPVGDDGGTKYDVVKCARARARQPGRVRPLPVYYTVYRQTPTGRVSLFLARRRYAGISEKVTRRRRRFVPPSSPHPPPRRLFFRRDRLENRRRRNRPEGRRGRHVYYASRTALERTGARTR